MKQAKKVAVKGRKLPGRRKILEKGRTDPKAKALPGVTPRNGAADPTQALANHWSKHPKLKTLTDLPRLVTEYEEVRKEEKVVTDKKAEVRGSLLTSLQLAGIEPSAPEHESKVACMGFEVFYTKGEKGRVIQERFEQELIQRGCPSDIMEAAREAARGEAPVTLQVRPIKALDVEGSKQ